MFYTKFRKSPGSGELLKWTSILCVALTFCFVIILDTVVLDRAFQVLKRRKSIWMDPIRFYSMLQIPYSRFYNYVKRHLYDMGIFASLMIMIYRQISTETVLSVY